MRFALRRPSVRSAAVTVAIVFAIGIAIGAAVGPAAVGETGAAQRPTIVLASAPAAAPVAASDSTSLDDASSADDAFASDDASSADEPAAIQETAAEPAASETPAATDPNTASSDPTDGGDDDTEDPASDAVPPGSKALAGVVVKTDADGQGFALAARDGRLLAIHAAGCGVALGDDLHLRARKLANGTWAADRVRRVSEAATTARAEGVVSWIDPAGGRYALAARGATLLVAIPAPTPDPAAPIDPATAAPAAPAPVLGERLRVRLQPADGDAPASLVEQARMGIPSPDPAAEPPAPLELDGAIVSVDQQARTLILALNEAQPSPTTVTLLVPSALDLTRLLPSERIAATATLAPDGTYALTGAAANGDASAADDASSPQGDQAIEREDSGTTQAVPAACVDLDPRA